MSGKRSIIAIAVVFIGVGGVLLAKRQEKPTPPADSFTATQIEAFYEGEDPIVVLTRTSTVAIRSDGSYAQMSHFTDPSGSVRTWVRRGITDIAAREFVSVDPFSESVSTYPMTPPDAAQESKRFNGTCDGEPGGKMLGFEVLVNHSTVAEPKQIIDRVVRSYWLAPELRCFPLRSEIFLYSKGMLTQRTIKTVTSVKVGEPPSWVFERPPNYVERAPSEANREAERRYPNHDCCKNISAGAEEEDKNYYERRGQK
jgi:hypothetical protein